MRRALSFLTPLGGPSAPGSTAWFPAAGAVMGLALGGGWWLASKAGPASVAAALVVADDLARADRPGPGPGAGPPLAAGRAGRGAGRRRRLRRRGRLRPAPDRRFHRRRPRRRRNVERDRRPRDRRSPVLQDMTARFAQVCP